MSSAVTAPMRAAGWNVRFTIGDCEAPDEFAGVYQNPRAPIVTFADVCVELALCFKFPGDQSDEENSQNANDVSTTASSTSSTNTTRGANTASNNSGGDTENSWTNVAFALTETPDEATDNPAIYPPFITRESLGQTVPGLSSPNMRQRRAVTYHIVHHKPCNLSAASLNDHLRAQCACYLSDPSRLRHPSYLPYNKIPSDSRLNIMPLRRKLKARSQSPPKRSAGSASPSKPDDAAADDDFNNMLAPASMDVDMDAAKKKVSDFRMACISQASCCAVSGDGEPWSSIQPIGPGVQACHIVPQQHYHLYPIQQRDDTAQDSARWLCQAWHKTWSPDNGILLMKHLHDFFDARLFSIHPTTLRIRVFVPYQALEPYHGQKAKVATSVDRKALRHHYEMCCIENMAAKRSTQEMPSPDDAMSGMSTSGASVVNTSGGGTTPFSGRTNLPMTPTSGHTLTTQAVLPTGDPSKRARSTRDDDEMHVNDYAEFWMEEQDDVPDVPTGKRRRRDEYGFDGYITPYNSREFLADVNWELLRFRGPQ